MNKYIFDFEVVAHDWILVVQEKETKEFTVFHNDNYAVQRFMAQKPLMVGFNNKRYDQYILKGVLAGFSPEDVKQINDYIIGGGNGWECPMLSDVRIAINQYDLMDDMQVGTSLKSIEAHLGLNIVESTVDFNITHKLTPEELDEMIYYCKYDVSATSMLDDIREQYINTKINLGAECRLKPEQATYLTNAKLTAKFLKAQKRTYNDERNYKYPDNLLREYIPQEVFDFFNCLYDDSIPDEDLFTRKLNLTVGECPVTIGFGGIHGAIPCYEETATDKRSIRNKDVASYYPNLMRVMGYCSRSMSDPELYAQTIARRVKAKKTDPELANALKLVLNTTYGATLDKFNDLYDPLQARSVCISGQLFLLELANHIVSECPSSKIVQLNTDGIMVSLDNEDEPKWQMITTEWQTRTGFELEEDFIYKIVQKDVNNYVEVATDGKQKLKGGMLVRGIGKAGAFKINNNAVIVAEALAKELADGIPVAETINACNDPMKFMLIAKASSKYKGAYHEVDGKMISVQKCNRVYASTDPRNGSLYKVGKNSDTYAKQSGLPMCCIIDNDNHCSIDDVDKEWYIREAQNCVNAFRGIENAERDARTVNSIKKEILKMLGE